MSPWALLADVGTVLDAGHDWGPGVTLASLLAACLSAVSLTAAPALRCRLVAALSSTARTSAREPEPQPAYPTLTPVYESAEQRMNPHVAAPLNTKRASRNGQGLIIKSSSFSTYLLVVKTSCTVT